MRRLLGFVVIVVLIAAGCTDISSELSKQSEGDLAFTDDPVEATATTDPLIQPAETVAETAEEATSSTVDVDDDASEDVDQVESGPRADLTIELSAVTRDGRGDGVVVAAGEVVTWAYQVTNTGDVDLTEVDVVDSVEGLVCTVNIDKGQTAHCEAISSAESGEFTTSAAATVTIDGTTVSATDHSGYVGLDDNRPAVAFSLRDISTTDANTFTGIADAVKTSSGSDPIYLSDFVVAVEANGILVGVSCTVETMPVGELPEFIVFDDEISLGFECAFLDDVEGSYDVAVNIGIGGSEEIITAEAAVDA